MLGAGSTLPLGGGSGSSGGPSGFSGRDIVWVDLRFPSGVGNDGTDKLPFTTANNGLNAVPDGGTLNFAGGDASTEPGITIGARSFTVVGFSGQEGSGGLKPVLPSLTYAITTGTQKLVFRHVSTTLIHSGTSAGLSSFEFFFCPTITLTGGTDASPVSWTGDANCTFSGSAGSATFSGGTIAGYVANGGGTIVCSNNRITGDLTSSSSVTIVNACAFSAIAITAPVIAIDEASLAKAITAGVTFSTPWTLLAPTDVESDIGTTNTAGPTIGGKSSLVGHGHRLTAAVWLAVGATITSPLSVNSQRITNLAAPVSANDAARLADVQAAAAGLKIKNPAVVAATSNQGTLSGTAQTIDGVLLNTIGQEVLLIAQTTGSQNGPWVIQSGAWTRPTDYATGSNASQAYVRLTGGSVPGRSYVCTSSAGSDVVDTNATTWVIFSDPPTITAGAGLVGTSTFDVVAADGTIVVGANDVRVGVIGNTNLADNTIALTRFANAGAQGDFLMRVSSGSGAWQDGTAAQARSALSIFQTGDWQPVRAATTGNITLSGTQTIDGVACIAGDRVLAWQQTTGSQNGLYSVASGAWSRCLDATSSSQFFGGMTVAISEGTANGNRVAMLTTNDPITVGSTTLTFDLSRVVALGAVAPQDVTTGAASIGTSTLAAPIDHVHHIAAATIAAAITDGNGLVFSGTTLNVVANADGSILANTNDIQVGVLATDAQHGNRGGGGIHAVATTSVAGFLAAADKLKLNDLAGTSQKVPYGAGSNRYNESSWLTDGSSITNLTSITTVTLNVGTAPIGTGGDINTDAAFVANGKNTGAGSSRLIGWGGADLSLGDNTWTGSNSMYLDVGATGTVVARYNGNTLATLNHSAGFDLNSHNVIGVGQLIFSGASASGAANFPNTATIDAKLSGGGTRHVVSMSDALEFGDVLNGDGMFFDVAGGKDFQFRGAGTELFGVYHDPVLKLRKATAPGVNAPSNYAWLYLDSASNKFAHKDTAGVIRTVNGGGIYEFGATSGQHGQYLIPGHSLQNASSTTNRANARRQFPCNGTISHLTAFTGAAATLTVEVNFNPTALSLSPNNSTLQDATHVIAVGPNDYVGVAMTTVSGGATAAECCFLFTPSE